MPEVFCFVGMLCVQQLSARRLCVVLAAFSGAACFPASVLRILAVMLQVEAILSCIMPHIASSR